MRRPRPGPGFAHARAPPGSSGEKVSATAVEESTAQQSRDPIAALRTHRPAGQVAQKAEPGKEEDDGPELPRPYGRVGPERPRRQQRQDHDRQHRESQCRQQLALTDLSARRTPGCGPSPREPARRWPLAPGEQLNETARTVVLRVAQEALRNIAKHSGASRAWLVTRFTDDPGGPGNGSSRLVTMAKGSTSTR